MFGGFRFEHLPYFVRVSVYQAALVAVRWQDAVASHWPGAYQPVVGFCLPVVLGSEVVQHLVRVGWPFAEVFTLEGERTTTGWR